VRLSLFLTLVSLLRQLHLSIGRGLLDFYLCLIFGEVDARWGESSSVKRKWILFSFTLYNAFFKKQNKAKIRYIMVKLWHLTIIKLLVPIMLSGGRKICQTSYSAFSLSLLWHLRRKKKRVAETGGFYLIPKKKSFVCFEWHINFIFW